MQHKIGDAIHVERPGGALPAGRYETVEIADRCWITLADEGGGRHRLHQDDLMAIQDADPTNYNYPRRQ